MSNQAAVYVRVSTVGQATDGKSSLETQKRECLSLAQEQGYTVPSDLIFQDVISGTKLDRPEFVRMISLAAQSAFSRLYVWSVDRFGRTMRHSVNAVKELEDFGVLTWSVKEKDLSNPIVFALFSALAESEHRRIIERTRPAKLAKRDAGYWVNGRSPYGYLPADDKTLLICPEEASVVRAIFRDSISGLGRTAIARRLNSGGILPPEAKFPMETPGKRRPRLAQSKNPMATASAASKRPQWQSRTIARILTNTMAYGESNGRRYIIFPAPIISRSEFDAARRAMIARRQKGKSSAGRWLLTSILQCSCGASYQHHEGRGSSHRYVCSAHRSGKVCINPPIKMADADEFVIAQVSIMLSNLSDEFLSEMTTELSRSTIEGLQKVLISKTEERGRIAAEHNAALADFSAARRAGVAQDNLLPYGDKIQEAGTLLDRLNDEVAELTANLNRIIGLDGLSESEVRAAVRELQSTFQLRARQYDAHGNLESEDDLADLWTVIRSTVLRVVVTPQMSLSIVFRDLHTDRTLKSFLFDLARREIEFVRLSRVEVSTL